MYGIYAPHIYLPNLALREAPHSFREPPVERGTLKLSKKIIGPLGSPFPQLERRSYVCHVPLPIATGYTVKTWETVTRHGIPVLNNLLPSRTRPERALSACDNELAPNFLDLRRCTRCRTVVRDRWEGGMNVARVHGASLGRATAGLVSHSCDYYTVSPAAR